MRAVRSAARAIIALSFGWAGGCGDPETNEVNEPLVPAQITTSAPERVRAGDPILVTCSLATAEGEEVLPEEAPQFRLRFSPESSVQRTESGDTIATVTGALEVACSAPELRLLDEHPPVIQVDPGPVAQLVTHLDRDRMTAGESVAATCDAFDAFGNAVADVAPGLRTEPVVEGNSADGLAATMTRTGIYDLACDLTGVASQAASLEVVPSLPAQVVISRVPDQGVYAIGEIVDIAHIVVDRFGNPIPEAQVAIVSVPPASVAERSRLRYFSDGTYSVTATVVGPVDGAAPLAASTQIVVDGNGPIVACDSPASGAILDVTPGTAITVSGSAADGSGVSQVRVNGTLVPLSAGGAFSAVVTTRFGINFVELAATDALGRESTRTCSFLVADTWATENAVLPSSVTLKLRTPSIDDGSRSGGISSLADILHIVLNSDGLADVLHDTLLDANPIKPSSCDQGGPFGTCILRSRMDYLQSDLQGPNTIALNLIANGMRATITLRNARMRLRISGTALGIGFSTTGWVTVDQVTVRIDFDVSLSGGRPRMAVRPGSVQTTVGNVDSDFDGVDGWILDVVISIAQDRVRGLISTQVTNLIRGSFNDALDGIMAGLDISALGTSFQVPRLGGGSPITLNFTPAFSSVATNTGRLMIGIGTRFTGVASHARPSLGAPLRPPLGPLDSTSQAAATVAMQEGLLSQALHTLWRAGFFDATIDGSTVGGSFPAGASATLLTGLPPAVRIASSSRVELALGEVGLTLSYPGLFSEPIQLGLGVRASLRFAEVGDDIAFDDFAIEELVLTSDQVSLDTSTKQVLEGFLTRVLERVISRALIDALPALPIPSFTLPGSLSDYGLPGGGELGIVSPALSTTIPFFLITGSLGVQ